MAAEIDFFDVIGKARQMVSVDHPLDRHEPFVVIGRIEQIVANATFPCRMNEPYIAWRHFCDNSNMADAAAFCTISFEKNQVAGFGIVQFHGFAMLGLRCAGMRK
jgi:hypothetical protein